MSISECHKLLATRMFEACHNIGYLVKLEYEVKLDCGIGFVDVAAFAKSIFLAIEVERKNCSRVETDLLKAQAINATELIIVVPNPNVRRLITARVNNLLRETSIENKVPVFVGCLPESIKRARHFFHA